jgi:hypothetical protein
VERDGDMSGRDVYTCGEENKCRQDFGGENLRKETTCKTGM